MFPSSHHSRINLQKIILRIFFHCFQLALILQFIYIFPQIIDRFTKNQLTQISSKRFIPPHFNNKNEPKFLRGRAKNFNE
jgi:hypothetical protein